MEVDLELLVSEVKSRKELWDYTSDGYHNKKRKMKAWDNICWELHPNFGRLSEKDRDAFVTLVMKKWRNLKDNHKRHLRNEKKSGAAAPFKKYSHADMLSFLNDLGSIKGAMIENEASFLDFDQQTSDSRPRSLIESENSWLNSPESEIESSVDTNLEVESPKRRTSKKRKLEAMIQFFSRDEDRDEDEDRAFFDSVLPTVRALTATEKLDFRMDVLNILKRYKEAGSSRIYGDSHRSVVYARHLSPVVECKADDQVQEIIINGKIFKVEQK